MQIAIIGAGKVGAALGRGWSRAGHEIRYGVPDPTDVKHRAAASGAGNAQVLTASASVAEADVIVLAVPWGAVESVVKACGNLSGRLVVDLTNPLRMGPDGLGLAIGYDGSGGETIARLAAGAHVFKSLNQVGYEVMSDASGFPTRPAMFVAGDDEGKAKILALVSDLGFDAIDAGPLRIARLLEPYAMLWILMSRNRDLPSDTAFAFMRRESADDRIESVGAAPRG